MPKSVSGFSKLSKAEKIDWLIANYFDGDEGKRTILEQYWNSDHKLQKLHDEFIENTITNYYLPFGIAPNFLINGKLYAVPMAIEESSVVAAASRAAKFWMDKGGFKAEVKSMTKVGQVHFRYKGDTQKLKDFFIHTKPLLIEETAGITANMKARGGGITDIRLIDKTNELDDYYQLFAEFETLDAMGANFINSCLEQFARTWVREASAFSVFTETEKQIEIVMSILSNYVPECLVKGEVSCSVEELGDQGLNGMDFAEKFIEAIRIAEVEPYRAVTHNKGIMNGIDAVILATGNDFRAVEAGVHAFASRNGRYSSLSHAEVENGRFKFWLEIPLALGTVGGLTRLHPLVRLALDMLDNPSAKELMMIVAAAGLAQNYGAVSSLITTGIQKGHMKMHLLNILNEFEASEQEKVALVEHFKTHIVTHSSVKEALDNIRK